MNFVLRSAPAPIDSAASDSFLSRPLPASVLGASFKAAQSYQADRVRDANRRARMATWFGVTGCVVAVSACTAIACLLPLKRTEWRLLEADRTTGVVVELPSFNDAVRSAPKGFSQWFAERYVQAQEDWVYDERHSKWAIVTDSSARDVSAEYEWKVSGKNPDGPAVRVGQKGTIHTHVVNSDIETDSKTGRSTATVRFLRQEQMDGMPPAPVEHWAASVVFETHPELIPANLRRVNPLGMIVLRYHSDKDELSQRGVIQ